MRPRGLYRDVAVTWSGSTIASGDWSSRLHRHGSRVLSYICWLGALVSLRLPGRYFDLLVFVSVSISIAAVALARIDRLDGFSAAAALCARTSASSNGIAAGGSPRTGSADRAALRKNPSIRSSIRRPPAPSPGSFFPPEYLFRRATSIGSLLPSPKYPGPGAINTGSTHSTDRSVGRPVHLAMAIGGKHQQPSLITIPALVPSTALTALLLSPKKRQSSSAKRWRRATNILSLWGILVAAFGFLSMIVFLSRWHPGDENCNKTARSSSSSSLFFLDSALDRRQSRDGDSGRILELGNLTDGEREFWKQPDDEGYKPCLEFSKRYRMESSRILSDRRNYLVVVVSGGLNQQRNQIIDAVVIARILGAALVVPVMQVNVIWGDDSEFSDIFDVEHFKTSLQDDVRIVTTLPSSHIGTRPAEEKRTPLNASPEWFRLHYTKRLRRDGILLLRGLDSRLSKDLPPDLQKLRCKVAFHALRFAAPIQALGGRITQRMWSQGPYLALHLRLEKDVWVRTGCLPGLAPQHDEEIRLERRRNPKLLTGRSNMTQEERQLAGLCPLTAKEVARLLRGLGATSRTRIYWAGGVPFGGSRALQPLRQEFPNLVNKLDLATPKELEPLHNKASRLAAIDYIVSLNSDVFMPSHGGNMGHALKGHRAYTGHRKHITPNKREMLPFFLNSSTPQAEFDAAMRELHRESVGQPAMWMDKKGRDVLGYPVGECMCKGGGSRSMQRR